MTSEEVIVAVMTIAGVTSSVGQPIVKISTREPQPACKLGKPSFKKTTFFVTNVTNRMGGGDGGSGDSLVTKK